MDNIFIRNSSDMIEELFNMFVQKKYGEVILHSEVEKILGFDKTQTKYGIYVRKAKDRLIPHSKILASIPRSWLASIKASTNIRICI